MGAVCDKSLELVQGDWLGINFTEPHKPHRDFVLYSKGDMKPLDFLHKSHREM